MMYFTRPPFWIRMLLPGARWSVPSGKGMVYLTFDDGPEPEITPEILDVLREFDMHASFFLLGKQAEIHPDIVERIRREGHAVGHHSWSHFNGLQTETELYISDVRRAADLVGGRLFRPPYGKIARAQLATLKRDFDVYMWTLMPGDFDSGVSPEKCLHRLIRSTQEGDIVVLHDNLKSANKVRQILPQYLEYLRERGWKSGKL